MAEKDLKTVTQLIPILMYTVLCEADSSDRCSRSEKQKHRERHFHGENVRRYAAGLSGSLFGVPEQTERQLRPPQGGCQADGGKSGGDGSKLEEPSSSSFSSRPGGDPVGSLSDSLYDSFSSCTSQGSNEV
ncbi:hypothetical protein NQZ68_002725 [Dissostichus eleginoides]|nr:hypothetical protein NQZ68_002725 [Dissostichus eleginoides]